MSFTFDGEDFIVYLENLPEDLFPITKQNFKYAVDEIGQMMCDETVDAVLDADNWEEAYDEIRDQPEALYVKTKRKITVVSLDKVLVILAYEGKALSFNIVQYAKDPFKSEEDARAFVEGEIAPFKAACNYGQVVDSVLNVMQKNRYYTA